MSRTTDNTMPGNGSYMFQESESSAGVKESNVPVCFSAIRYIKPFSDPPASGSGSGCAAVCAGYEAPVRPDQHPPRSGHKVLRDESH